MDKFFQQHANFFHYWQFVWRRLNEDRCGQMASALTLTTLLSLVPLLTVIFTVLGAVPAFREQASELMRYVLTHFLPSSVEVIQSYLHQFTDKATELTTVGGVLLFLTAVIIFANIEQALNTIWRVPVKRKGIGAFVLYWAILTLIPVVVVGSIALTSYVSLLQPILFSEVSNSKWINIFPFIITVVIFTLLYIMVPNAKVPLNHALIGGFVAAVLFAIGRFSFHLYVQYSPSYQLLYGALAILPIFAIWIFLSWVFILIGAEITHALRYYDRKSLGKLPYFLIVYRWLGLIWYAQHNQQRLTLPKLLSKQAMASLHDAEAIIENLVQNGWLRKTKEDDYVLAKDLHEVSLLDLYRSLAYPLPTITELRDNMERAEKFIGDDALLKNVGKLDQALQASLLPTLADCFPLEEKIK